MSKPKKQRFVLNLKLNTEKFQEDILEKRFEVGRQIYNSVLNIGLKRYNKMIKTKKWRENQSNLAEVYKTCKDKKQLDKLIKPLYKIRNETIKEYGLFEYSFHSDVKLMQNKFKKNIDCHTSQKIATRVWTAFEDLLFDDGKKVYFKKYSEGLNSLESKANSQGIRYKEKSSTLEWNGLVIPVELDIDNQYEIDSLRNKICYCRIVRKFIRGKYKYVLQLVLEGVPPIKINKQTGEVKNDIGIGTTGIDIGTQTVAYTSDYDCKLLELAPRVQNIENEKRRLLRYMDRSRRSMNPSKYNKDRTINKGNKNKWIFSNKYIKAKNKLKDLYRKQADIRRLDHNIMANEIIAQCNIVLVEKMNFKGLQKRSKKTEKNNKGKFKKKKRFGKSLANKAPAMLLTIIKNKIEARNGSFIEVNTWKVKASQYNHLNQEYNKKKLSQRWNEMEYEGETIKVQRDLYSSFLIKNVMEDLKTIDNELCTNDFDKFLELHNKEIKRLKMLDNLSSMGI